MFGKKFGKKKLCLVKNSCQNRRASTGSRLPFPVTIPWYNNLDQTLFSISSFSEVVSNEVVLLK